MNDRLQKVHESLRVLSAAASTVAAAFFNLMFCRFIGVALREGAGGDIAGMFAALTIFAALAFSASYLAWRLWRNERAANGITVMPTWFIQAFGVLFFAGMVFAAYMHGDWILAVKCSVVMLPMILVGRHIAARYRQQAPAAEAPSEDCFED